MALPIDLLVASSTVLMSTYPATAKPQNMLIQLQTDLNWLLNRVH
jgi:hypothetical protein